MSLRRPAAAAALATLAVACATPPDPAVASSLAWLWQKQQGNGLVTSDVYGVLRRGESLTAAALLASARWPAEARAHEAAIERAFAALAARATGDAPADAPVDYPCYTAAHWLHALVLLQPDGWRDAVAQRVATLRTLQFSSANGWTPADDAFGGFGLGGGPPRAADGDALVTLSTTTAAVEALRAAGVPTDDPAIVAARFFVERCQRFGRPGDDGGFRGAPGPGQLGSKGGVDAAGVPCSYGPATADGLRALLACGHRAESPRVRAAVAWLARHGGDPVPGLRPEFEPSLRLYHAAALALAATTAAPPPADLVARARERVREGVQPDGSFRGFGDAMKEDDPVVATVLALTALR